jgi:hypothetical protein
MSVFFVRLLCFVFLENFDQPAALPAKKTKKPVRIRCGAGTKKQKHKKKQKNDDSQK